MTQSYYFQFTNRKQKNEDYAAYGLEIERFARLAYPECAHEVRGRIACAQFVPSSANGFVKRTLQLEGITSIRMATERTKVIKKIHGDGFGKRVENGEWKTGREK